MMLAIATLILLSGMADDLFSRKVHNELFVGAFVLALASSLYFREWSGTQLGLLALLLGALITIPMFAARMIGGGDVKLVLAFAMAVEPAAVFWTLAYSVVWGALFGFTRSAVQGQLPILVRNTFHLATRKKVQQQELHKIPYTFALLLGWFTHLTMVRVGGL